MTEPVHPDFRRALDALPLGVTITDAGGMITYINPADAEMHGYTVGELIGKPGRILGAPSARQTLSPADMAQMERWARETLNARKDGSTFPVQLWSEAIRDATGRYLGMITVTEDITEKKRAAHAQVRDALQDPITGLASRTFFHQLVERAARRLERHPDYAFAVLLLDLDRFSLINESLGHDAGDALLAAVGERLREVTRADDVCARIAGDKFAILLDDLTEGTDATRAALRVVGALEAPFSIADREVFLPGTVGLALGAPGHEDAEEYMANATAAMERARAGDIRYEVFDRAEQRRASARLRLETDLRLGIERDELLAVYQPIVDLASEAITGLEALVRWRRGDQGLVAPGDFIPVAEETGLIVPVGTWMLREACRCTADWLARGIGAPELTINVNVSVRHLRHGGFLEDLEEILADTGLPPRHLKLEVTESLLMVDAEAQVEILRALRAFGVGTAIDDFGTGYSSLSYLQRFHVDTLKIDRSFLGAADASADWEIVRMIISLAHTMGVAVVAEGVETAAQRDRLRELECDRAQGYLFAKPVDAAEAEGLLTRRRSPA